MGLGWDFRRWLTGVGFLISQGEQTVLLLLWQRVTSSSDNFVSHILGTIDAASTIAAAAGAAALTGAA